MMIEAYTEMMAERAFGYKEEVFLCPVCEEYFKEIKGCESNMDSAMFFCSKNCQYLWETENKPYYEEKND